MSDDGYHGWTNRDTWLVNLWLDNDHNTYMMRREAVALVYKLCRTFDAEHARRVFDSLDGSALIGDPFDVERVEWSEIAEAWKNEANDDQ